MPHKNDEKRQGLLIKKDHYRPQHPVVSQAERDSVAQIDRQQTALAAEKQLLQIRVDELQTALPKLCSHYETRLTELVSAYEAEFSRLRRQLDNASRCSTPQDQHVVARDRNVTASRHKARTYDYAQSAPTSPTSSIEYSRWRKSTNQLAAHSPTLANGSSLAELKLANHCRSLEAQFTVCQTDNNRLQQENLDLLERIAQVEAQLERVSQMTDVDTVNRQLLAELDDTQAYINTLDIQSEQLMTELANEVEELQEELELKHRDLTVMYQQLTEKNDECQRLTAKVESLEATVNRQRSVIDALQDDYDRLKDLKKEGSKDKDELILHSAHLAHEVQYLTKERENIAQQVAQLGLEMIRHHSMVEDLQRRKEKLLAEVGNVSDEVDDDQTIDNNFQNRIDAQDKTLNSQRLQLKQMEAEFRDQKLKLAEYETKFQYLKTVVLKFITAQPTEAVQLQKAIAVLFRLSPEEEKSLARDLTLGRGSQGQGTLGRGSKGGATASRLDSLKRRQTSTEYDYCSSR